MYFIRVVKEMSINERLVYVSCHTPSMEVCSDYRLGKCDLPGMNKYSDGSGLVRGLVRFAFAKKGVGLQGEVVSMTSLIIYCFSVGPRTAIIRFKGFNIPRLGLV